MDARVLANVDIGGLRETWFPNASSASQHFFIIVFG